MVFVDLLSERTSNRNGSSSDKPGPEAAYRVKWAESSSGAASGLESPKNKCDVWGSDRPSNLHRDRLIDAAV
jgi:hypothetical protein